MFLSCFLPACHQFFRPFFNTVFGFFFQSSDPFFHLWILFSMCWSRSLISENFYRDRVQQQKFDHFLLIFLALLLLFLIEILGKKLNGKKLKIYIYIYIYICSFVCFRRTYSVCFCSYKDPDMVFEFRIRIQFPHFTPANSHLIQNCTVQQIWTFHGNVWSHAKSHCL